MLESSNISVLKFGQIFLQGEEISWFWKGLACGQVAHGCARGSVRLCNSTIKHLFVFFLFSSFFLVGILSIVVHMDLCVYATSKKTIKHDT